LVSKLADNKDVDSNFRGKMKKSFFPCQKQNHVTHMTSTSIPSRLPMEVQTRSEKNGLGWFTSVAAAREAYLQDRSIWKISFAIGDTDLRYRPMRVADLESWSMASQKKALALCPLLEVLRQNRSQRLLWVQQDVLSKVYDLRQVDEETYLTSCLTQILTDEEFVATYCK
jgi:hypothetical protein